MGSVATGRLSYLYLTKPVLQSEYKLACDRGVDVVSELAKQKLEMRPGVRLAHLDAKCDAEDVVERPMLGLRVEGSDGHSYGEARELGKGISEVDLSDPRQVKDAAPTFRVLFCVFIIKPRRQAHNRESRQGRRQQHNESES